MSKLVFMVAFIFLASPAIADSLLIDNNRYDGPITGIRDGRLTITIRGTPRQYDLTQIQSIALDAAPKLADAEAARTDDPKTAAALYKQLIPALNNADLKRVIEWRAIEPTDKDGRWVEAVSLFLDVYQASPDEAVWKVRPTHMPAAGSSMLPDSADKITAALKNVKDETARKNLKMFLLDIYTKAGDTQSANRLAKELSTGIVEESVAVPTKPVVSAQPSPTLAMTLTDIDTQMKAKNYEAAAHTADAALRDLAGHPPVNADAAVQLFSLEARAEEAGNHPEVALATWLRIPAHYPTHAGVPGALLHALQLQRALNHPEAAAALGRELLEKFPDTPEAASGK